jgi:hypothetical protein
MINHKTFKLTEEYERLLELQPDDVISTGIEAPVNFKRLEKFLENVKNGIKDYIRIIRISVDGEPKLYRVYYDGDKIKVLTYSKDSRANTVTINKFMGDNIQINDIGKFIRYNLIDENGKDVITLYAYGTWYDVNKDYKL